MSAGIDSASPIRNKTVPTRISQSSAVFFEGADSRYPKDGAG